MSDFGLRFIHETTINPEMAINGKVTIVDFLKVMGTNIYVGWFKHEN
jgi:hypothetical protein